MNNDDINDNVKSLNDNVTAEKKMADAISKLNLVKQPERDLWSGINNAITNQELNQQPTYDASRGVASKPLYAVAASILLISIVGWLSFESGKTLQGNELVAALSSQHQQQKQTLLIRYKDQPTATQNWQEQLDDLDQAAAAIKKALDEEPNNAALLKMLSHVYEQQMTLIERVHAPSWSRV